MSTRQPVHRWVREGIIKLPSVLIPKLPTFPFERLPHELKLDIIEEVIPQYTLPQEILAIDGFERTTVKPLLLSCRLIRDIVKDKRRLVAVHQNSRVMFTFDLNRDTLLVYDMQLPKFQINGESAKLPVRKILTKSPTPVIPTGINPTEDQLEHFSEEPWQGLPFDTSLPILDKLPCVEEFIVVCRILPINWHIEDLQVFGPDIIGQRTDEENWGLSRAYNYPNEYQAADYFQEKGIIPDTGIFWHHPFGESQPVDMISADEDLAINIPGQHCVPYIGFKGYSKGSRSLGGKWAGFLYDRKTGNVKFRPLEWYEVTGIKEARKGDSYLWLDVKAKEEDDPEWVGQLETTWKMVRTALVQDSVDYEYTMRTN
ncbi:hypothetical protein HG530_005628 [Fusarium avenaceum]|nr:hypothetical protein HG530_005628 [Fusarium avenaceum]